MSERLLAAFPSLRTSPYRITSPADRNYNCIAWAAGLSSEWWWPLEENVDKVHWPLSAPREVTLDAFHAAFATLGFEACSDDGLDPAFEKVAIFVDQSGLPSHAARQLFTGRWTSKLGRMEDIEHELRALEGDEYGVVALFLRRKLAT